MEILKIKRTMVYAPIYKDTYYTTGGEYVDYSISYNGSTIFSGRAYSMPNGGGINININRIAQRYLQQNMDTLFSGSGSESNPNAIGDFALYVNGGNAQTYRFLYCYDYDFIWNGGSATLSNPVCDEYGYGMFIPTTTCNGSSVSTSRSTPSATCKGVKYGLYYVNARGGWDAFAIQGNGVQTDSFKQFETDKAFNNTTREFERDRYLNEIESKYELTTHFLDDEQSYNLAKNLFSSNKVYLHNLMDGTIKPVVITDTSVKYQTFQGNGKKFSQYKINVVESQAKLRR